MPRDLGPDVTEDVRDGPPPPLDGFAPLAVWLETGYDGGRIAAWVPDVPGRPRRRPDARARARPPP